MFTGTGRHVMTLSPDGTKLVYVANEQLYLRNMHELTSAPIPGTEGSNPIEPVFSPDGQWVAFYSRGALKKVPVTGGTPVLLSRGRRAHLGATWEDGRILLGQPTPPAIVEIPENGGAANQLVTLNEKTGEQAAESAARRGRAVSAVYVAHARGRMGRRLDRRPRIWRPASARCLLQGTDARVLPTGHLVFAREGTIFAVPFDETRLTVTGGPVPIQQGIQTSRATGTSHVAWSASGTFAIAQGSTDEPTSAPCSGSAGRARRSERRCLLGTTG